MTASDLDHAMKISADTREESIYAALLVSYALASQHPPIISSTSVALAPGTRLGPYEVTVQIGAGGMGEVYRATDTNLKRAVAIKVLPSSVSADPERQSRFQREAEVLATLNDPHIAQIYGVEKAGGTLALVMELIEGPSLADRIAKGPIPLDEVLPIGKQIAEALETAHEQGIIHRDLKPANIKVRGDGTVKVLDFGLAKALDPVGVSRSANLSMSPTITTPAMTQAGIILGTAAYMAPEQARGKTVDRRADIWAFGVVLFEMLSGRRAFDGDDLSITLASVLKTEPDWQTLPSATPVGIRGLLRRCLEKDPKRRLQAIGEARVQIENLLSGAAEESVPVTSARPSPNSRAGLAWALSAAAFIAVVSVAAIAAWLWWARPSAEPAKVSFDIITESSGSPNQIALSPDGTRLAAAVNSPKGLGIWLRRLDDVSGQVLAGTVGIGGSPMPFWSPDSRSLAFFGLGKLNTIDLSGGPAVPLCDAPNPRGGTWNRDGWILFAPSDGPLFKCRTTNAVPLQVTALDRARGDLAHQHPKFLPDGVHFIFLVVSTKPENTGVYLGALNSQDTKQLVASNEMGVFAAPDHLLFMRGAAVMAQRFDTRQLKLEGDPFPVAQDVGISQTGNGVAGIAASDTGVLAYRSGNLLDRVLRWVDRTGKPLGDVGEPGSRVNVALAPGGERLAETRVQGAASDIWITNLLRGGDQRFTFGPSRQDHAIWSPDGRHIVFAAVGDGAAPDLYLGEPGSKAQAELLWKSESSKFPTDWSSDGRYILYTEVKNSYDVWVLPLSGDKKPFPFLNTATSESWGRFSPDGQWVAYISTETGPPQVYVQAFPHGGHKEQVSITTGVDTHWRSDGRELFYVTLDPAAIWAVDVLTTNDTTFKAGVPHKLFDAVGIYRGSSVTLYDVTRDGQRFLLNTSNTATSFANRPIRVVVNWNTTSKP
jgi:serine/threonine protein kinase